MEAYTEVFGKVSAAAPHAGILVLGDVAGRGSVKRVVMMCVQSAILSRSGHRATTARTNAGHRRRLEFGRNAIQKVSSEFLRTCNTRSK